MAEFALGSSEVKVLLPLRASRAHRKRSYRTPSQNPLFHTAKPRKPPQLEVSKTSGSVMQRAIFDPALEPACLTANRFVDVTCNRRFRIAKSSSVFATGSRLALLPGFSRQLATPPSVSQAAAVGRLWGRGGWPTYILRPTCRSAPRGVDSGVGERRQEPRVFGRVGRPGRPTFPGCGWYQAVRTAPQAREFVREVW